MLRGGAGDGLQQVFNPFGAGFHCLDVKHPVKARAYLVQLGCVQAANHPVVGQHQHAGVVKFKQGHHHKILGLVLTRSVGGLALPFQTQRGLVPMVSIGQEYRDVRESGGDGVLIGLVGYTP